MYTIHLGFSRDVSFQMQYVKFCSISSYNTHSLLHVVSINLWLKKFTENVYIHVPLTKVLNNATLDTFNWYTIHNGIRFAHLDTNGFFFQSNTHIVSCAVRMRPCLLLTCFRFIRVLQKLIMTLEVIYVICTYWKYRGSSFNVKQFFPRPLLCLSIIFSYLINKR